MTHAPNEDRQSIELIDFLIAVRIQWKRHTVIPAFSGLLAIALSFFVTPTFKAETTILPPQQASGTSAILGSLGGLGAAAVLGGGGIKNPVDQWVSFAKSRHIEDALIAKFRLQSVYGEEMLFKARETLESRTTITSGKDGLITIEVEDSNPELAASIANGYVDQLNALNNTLAVTEASQRRKFFEEQLSKSKNALSESEARLHATGVSTSVMKATPEAAVLEVSQLKAHLKTIETKLAIMRGSMTETNPEYLQAIREMQSIRSQIDANAKPSSSTKRDSGADYIEKYRDFKYQEAIFEVLVRQYELAKSDEAKEGSLVQVIDKATPPEWKSRPKRALIGIIAFIVAIFTTLSATTIRLLIEHQMAIDQKYATKIRNLISNTRPQHKYRDNN